MNIAIIGCGLIGEKRAKALGVHRLVAVADPNLNRAQALADTYGQQAKVFADWKEVVHLDEVDLVVVATTNNFLAPITLYAVKHGKHVIVEKPAGKTAEELKVIVDEAKIRNVKVKVGFNLRFHPAIHKAKQMVDGGDIGELMFVRGRYGHGGRVGYDREWRSDPQIAGGGELIDQGVHLIDLSRWFLGNLSKIDGYVDTYFWDMVVDDNAFLALRNDENKMAWLHASCSEWKNMFSFEIYGRKGKLQIDGLGGSYGLEKLTFYKMLVEMGPPETTSWEYPGPDKSWNMEFDSFINSIDNGLEVCGNIDDAYETMRVVDKIYGGKYL
jgi:predicted dehydrogenase